MIRIYLALAAAAALLSAQEPETPAPPQTGERPAVGQRPAAEPEIKPYGKVITKDAKTTTGVFTVHRIKDKIYYEIPTTELGKDFLLVTQLTKTTLGVGYGGGPLGSKVVRWDRRDKKVLFKIVQYDIVADSKLPIAKAVEAANHHTILLAFNIEAIGKDDAPVIEVTRMFTSEVQELSARTRLRARGFDATRSFLERVSTFPANIEVEATHTYTLPMETIGVPGAPGPTPPTPAAMFSSGMKPGSATVVVHWSMVKLPEKPMMPRLFDERVGYFSTKTLDYGHNEQKAAERSFISRWRLEKKDTSAALSEPVKPIVFYVDAGTPAKWVPHIIRGIEKWQAAFEEAGFKNAIIGKPQPQDPEFSCEDARYACIRWLPSTVENAMGPHISDPRTGEILDADIQMFHNVMNLNKHWYFVQVSPLDPRAQQLPLPEEIAGRLLEYVVTHEVGHSLGFQHNMKASSMYPQDKVRDREWVKKMGHVPTLMDYSRFNYVAQPEDKIDPEDLIPRIGPYDKWATMWGYKPIPGAATPDDEKQTLDEWARAQDTTPWLRFSTTGSRGSDPGELTEAVGDADAVASTALGMKNLERVMGYLLKATTRKGESFEELEQMYSHVLGQWSREMGHVAAIVGGVHSQQKHGGQQGVIFTPVPRARQAAAVGFLNANAFHAPEFLINPEITRRIEPDGLLARLQTAQMGVLNSALSNTRLVRMLEQEALDGAKAYKPIDFLEDLRKGIFSELSTPKVSIDAFRRNTQRGYLEAVNERLNGAQSNAQVRPLYRAELRALSAEVNKAQTVAADRTTRAHLEDMRDQIAKMLDPKFEQRSSLPAAFTIRRGVNVDDEETCWPDYAIHGEPR